MSQIAEIASQLHELDKFNKLGGVDTFFGRMALFESELGKRHEAVGKEWRKPGRYGNIIEFEPVMETIDYVLECEWEPSWLFELSSWYKDQGRNYGMPDCAFLSIVIDIHLKQKGFVLEEKDDSDE